MVLLVVACSTDSPHRRIHEANEAIAEMRDGCPGTLFNSFTAVPPGGWDLHFQCRDEADGYQADVARYYECKADHVERLRECVRTVVCDIDVCPESDCVLPTEEQRFAWSCDVKVCLMEHGVPWRLDEPCIGYERDE